MKQTVFNPVDEKNLECRKAVKNTSWNLKECKKFRIFKENLANQERIKGPED